MTTYLITYIVLNDRGAVVKSGKMKVRNCEGDSHARNKIRKHLSDVHWDFHRLSITSVEEVIPTRPSGGFDSILDDLFGSQNPFK